jgi:hypothetical protein
MSSPSAPRDSFLRELQPLGPERFRPSLSTQYLKTDYALTDAPVPDGLGPNGGQAFLRE